MVEGDPSLEHRIGQTFLKLWALKRQLPVDALVSDPLTALAAVILFDQFPRNMLSKSADPVRDRRSRRGHFQGSPRKIIERFGRFPTAT